MTRYLIFGILGLILSYFVLITAPDNSKIVDTIGLIIFAIGTGLYQKTTRIAGFLTLFGLGIIAHVVGAWWYNVFAIEIGFITYHILFIYVLLSVSFIALTVLAIHAAINNKAFRNKLDQI